MTNTTGAITDTYDYDAFGNKVNSTGTTPNNYLYRAEQYDPDLGLYYLRARYYNPISGRFMGRDPEDGLPNDPQSLHKYLYAGGDPVNRVDPSGRMDGTTAGRMPGTGSEYATLVLNVSLATTASVAAVACAINVNDAYDALKVEGAAFFKVDLPVTPDPLKCGADSKCVPYEEAIQVAMEEVETRYNQLLLDIHYLYEYACKNPKNPWTEWGSWGTHVETYLDAQADLIGAIAAAKNAGCPVSAEAEYWAKQPPPTANARCGGQ